jgi:predicted alpha-1,2-mannosidase
MHWNRKYGRDYTEGNAWQYTWHVLHDPEGLADLMGGRSAFYTKLNAFFTLPDYVPVEGEPKTVILGFVGQYAHGNEPSHHVAYLFPYAGRPGRTAEIVRKVCSEQYVNKPDGLTGNDDCGQMSAWYIFSNMGFYPVNPCADGYVLGAPQLPEMTVDVGNGRTLKIIAKNLSKENLYVKRVRLNGKRLGGIRIRHEDIVAGGELVYEMTERK